MSLGLELLFWFNKMVFRPSTMVSSTVLVAVGDRLIRAGCGVVSANSRNQTGRERDQQISTQFNLTVTCLDFYAS